MREEFRLSFVMLLSLYDLFLAIDWKFQHVTLMYSALSLCRSCAWILNSVHSQHIGIECSISGESSLDVLLCGGSETCS